MKRNFRAIFVPHWFAVWLVVTWQSVAFAAHQTDTLTPIVLNGSLPYKISLQPYDFGAAELPTLHSYAAGHHDGKWVLISGKTNGLHGFETTGPNGFLPEFQNREVWVIDPVNKQSWHRSLEGAAGGLTTLELNSLTPANNQFYQRGNRLYMTGGYGVQATLGDGTPVNGTFDRLSALDLPGLVDWVTTGSGVAKDHIRQIASPSFRVTGGAMYEMDGRTHIVFGQDFSGNYNPNKNGTYTNQVRSFEIVDDGTTLAITNAASTTPNANFRRRDLNVFPVIRPAGGGASTKDWSCSQEFLRHPLERGPCRWRLTRPGCRRWTIRLIPTRSSKASMVTIRPSWAYFRRIVARCTRCCLAESVVQYLNPQTMQVETDNDLPFINDITSVVVDPAGDYSQHWIGEFPIINDLEGKRLRFGSNAEFFLAEGIETFENGVIKLDELNQPTTLGYVFGGIMANGPHTRSGNPPATSAASNIIFAVVYTHVPEPSNLLLAAAALAALSTIRFRSGRLRLSATPT